MRYLLYLLFLATACASSIGFTQTGNTYNKTDGYIEVYFEEPEFKFEQIGVLSISQNSDEPDTKAISRLQHRARSLGANALLIQSIRDQHSEESTPFTQTKITALAIRIEKN